MAQSTSCSIFIGDDIQPLALGNRDGLNEMKLTQKELARQLGVSTTRVNDFTSGRAEPSLSLAGSICRILKISPAAMMRM